MDIVIGIDIGQRVDPTAIAVAEVSEETPPVFTIRFLERLPLGTPYPQVAKRLAAVADGAVTRVARPAVAVFSNGRPYGRDAAVTVSLTIVTDITGVGRPVHELLEAEIAATPLQQHGASSVRLEPATFTHGDRLGRSEGGGRSVGKAYLVSRLQALLQTDRIKLPRTREAEALARELLDYEIRVDEDANDKYGAFKVGTHDDLVTALGLVVLRDWRSQPSMVFDGRGRRVGWDV